MSKVLIVDDDPNILFLYEEELKDEGYDVVTLSNCSKIIDMIVSQEPDLVVLDIDLGEADGLDLLQDIKNCYEDMHVILCTAYLALHIDLESIAADYCLVKSPDLTELKSKIKRAIHSSKCFSKPSTTKGTGSGVYFSEEERFIDHGAYLPHMG